VIRRKLSGFERRSDLQRLVMIVRDPSGLQLSPDLHSPSPSSARLSQQGQSQIVEIITRVLEDA
jgi:hypothetical protein